ncbi:serine/threonine-protein kinase [Amycolatopsis sp. NPDC059021]|uniref:serine/threonine-protein kinase n=1 Tax=Amycolatopsis sp. NPDC059021 TaxID=3346704 RepID=UPI00366C45A6
MRTGDVIASRYRLEDELGSGSNGVVWSAFDRKLKRLVALKRPHSLRGETERDRFRREAENAAQVYHPNVVSVFDTVDDDECWLVMEYLPSRSLDKLIEDGPLAPERVARIGAQVAAALEALHFRGVVHRDVKPGNILVTENDLAKLADFGIAVWRDVTLTDDGRITGTAAYVAPEVANGKPATTASDVFSLGAALFAAVEGTPPFGTGHPEAVLARARKGTIPPMRQAGPLAPVLADMLRTRPGERPGTAEVAERLRECAGGWEPPITPPPSPPGRQGRGRRRRVYWLGGTAAVLVIAAVAVLLVSLMTAPSDEDVIGDPRTVDPCALADQDTMRQFGRVKLQNDYGGFERCDIFVEVGAPTQVDLKFEFTAPDPGVPRAIAPGEFAVHKNPRSGDECDRWISVTQQVDARVTAKQTNPTADLCGMADVATKSVVAKLRQGRLPRREPFNPASLANFDACGLFNGGALAGIPGIDAIHPEVGFGNWKCAWKSTTDYTELHVLFDQNTDLTADSGGPTQLFGHEAYVESEDEGGKGTCRVRVVHRPYADQRGRKAVELVLVEVEGRKPGKDFCQTATDIGRAAATALPS